MWKQFKRVAAELPNHHLAVPVGQFQIGDYPVRGVSPIPAK